MKHSGSADLPLMGGHIPDWLFRRMKRLSLAVVESILVDYGAKGFLSRLSDPFWFQSFGAVIGMDWNSSGVTTAITRALKSSLNPHANSLGLYVCGGKGKSSLQTPAELLRVGDKTGLDGDFLARSSKLSAKVDNTAIQDGYQLYIHSFIVSKDGDWTVIQQGMKPADKSARRYHWHSEGITSFVSDPHAAICGEHQGKILNLTDVRAEPAQQGILDVTSEKIPTILREMTLPGHKGVRASDVDLKRLGAVLQLAQEAPVANFEELLLLKGVGPRTLRSLALVSEVIHGTPTRFTDPARFAFAHGSKGGNPAPVPTHVYDETIEILRDAVQRARVGETDKQAAIKNLSRLARRLEEGYTPKPFMPDLLKSEQQEAWRYGGRTVNGYSKPPQDQLDLFD